MTFKKFFLFSVALFVLLVPFSCTKKVVSNSGALKKEIAYKEIYKHIDKQVKPYKNFQADVKLLFTDNGKKLGGTGDLRVEHGKQIFMRVKKFGFEVGRAWITRDKIVVKNSFQREYIEEDLSRVKEEFGLEPNFDLIEEILVGLPQLEYKRKQKTQLQNDKYQVKGKSPLMEVNVQAEILAKLMQVVSATYSTANKDAVDVTYSQELSSLGIPMERTFVSKPKDDVFEVTYKIRSLKEGEGNIPAIEIPSGYRKRDF